MEDRLFSQRWDLGRCLGINYVIHQLTVAREMSVLTQSKTSATIRADSSPTEIYVTEVSFMNRLFQTEPG